MVEVELGLIKCFLFVLIFLASTYVGIIISSKYKNRVIDLKELKTVLNIMNTKIRYTYEPIGEICEEISQMNDTNVGKLFGQVNLELKDKNITEAWNIAIDTYGNNFSKEDKHIIKTLGKMLGKTDINGQVSEIEQANEFLNIQINKAEKERQKNEKLYKSLGMVIGIAIIIILV